MGKKILFSPIGGNDPVSSSTEYDGSMLHICRHYKPDEVYLFLSKEMVERHHKDNRYGYCIEKLGEKLTHNFQVFFIEQESLEEVQEYDYYYDIFQPILHEIENKMEREDVLFVNIASGTPAMKSALLMLAVISEYKIQPVQVHTPEKGINVHNGKDLDYDPEYYWAVNKDNEGNSLNRCVEPQCPNLKTILKKNILIRHIKAYDYSAAFMLAEEIKEDISEEAYHLIELAVARIQLDINTAKKIADQYGFTIFPVVDNRKIKIFEYALALKIKIVRKEYGDFIRAISPLLSDLFEEILKEQCNIKIHDFCEKDSKDIWIWKIELLKQSDLGRDLLDTFNEEFQGKFKNTPVAASNLKPILVRYLPEDKRDVKRKIEEVRKIEAKVRNIAAHEIVSITEEAIPKMFGGSISIDYIFKLLKALTVEAKVPVSKSDWKSYDEMNYLIEQYLQ